tara:strand:- start:1109 stop:1393 length:285 start_codon:yes stop_codon:yes gene_type:complete
MSTTNYKSQIINLITMIINKERKKINKWKHEENWVNDDGVVSDADTFYHLCNYIQQEGWDNIFMNYVHYEWKDNEHKWRSIKKRNEFFNTFLSN